MLRERGERDDGISGASERGERGECAERKRAEAMDVPRGSCGTSLWKLWNFRMEGMEPSPQKLWKSRVEGMELPCRGYGTSEWVRQRNAAPAPRAAHETSPQRPPKVVLTPPIQSLRKIEAQRLSCAPFAPVEARGYFRSRLSKDACNWGKRSKRGDRCERGEVR